MKIRRLFSIQSLLAVLLLSLSVHAQTQPAAALSEVEDLANTLVTLKSSGEREQLLTKKKDLMTPDLRKALLRQGNVHLLAGRYSTAFEIYGLAQNIAEQIGDKEGVAAASMDIGAVYYFQANYPAALEHYRKARELFTEVTNNYESAKALSGLALIYKEQRRDSEALAALQQALKEFTSLNDKPEIASTLNSIGTIYYGQGNYSAAAEAFKKSAEANTTSEGLVRLADSFYMQGDYSQALNLYKESLSFLTDRDLGAVIASLNGAANSAYYQGNYDEALQYYERNAAIQKTQADKLGFATSLKGIGNVHRSRGDYAAALDSYFSSLRISEEIKAPIGTTLGSIGFVRAIQRDYVRALDYYGKALKEFEASSNKIEMARVLSLIGNAHYMQGSYDLALETYRQALSLREETDDKSGQGDVLAGIGSTLLRQKNYSAALDSYERALALFASIGNKESMAEILTRVSEAFLLQSDYAKALSAAESAASIARQLDHVDLLWYSRMLEGKAHQKLDHGPQAYQAFTEAVSIVESLRSRPPSMSGGQHDYSLPYLSLIDHLLTQHRPGEAFDYAERAKVQVMFDPLRNSKAATNRDLSAEELAQEQRLAGEVASIEFQLDREAQLRTSNETRRGNLRDRLRQARTAFANFRQELFTAHRRLKVDRGELEPLKLDEMSSLIADTATALLEFAVTENNTYLFVLTAEKGSPKQRATIQLKVYPLEIKNDELIARVGQFQRQMIERVDDFQQSSRDLYDLLIKPADDQLVLKTRLIVVPDGVLWRLPFEALQPSPDHFVVDQMQVSYAPSLAALREMRSRRVRVNRNSVLVGMGNPTLSKEFADRVALAYSNVRLESSAQQEDELKRVGMSYGSARSRSLIGVEASEDRLRMEASQSGILHFSTPGLLDETSPMSSFIGLASSSGKPDEGFLQVREIMNLQTSAQLVVLSGTQRHGQLHGAATPSFSWSWFVAGSPATMLSRWQVEAAPQSRLLSQFYSTIRPRPGMPVSGAKALHQSIMSLRRSAEYKHPYYWASFAIIGDAR